MTWSYDSRPLIAANDNRPRLMTKKAAAAYLGVTPATFSKWVLAGIIPPPVSITGRWDRKAIDAELDKRSGLTVESETEDAFDIWKREQNAQESAGRR